MNNFDEIKETKCCMCSFVHMNFPNSPRKSYVPHTSFLGFSALLQNDENVHTTILH